MPSSSREMAPNLQIFPFRNPDFYLPGVNKAEQISFAAFLNCQWEDNHPSFSEAFSLPGGPAGRVALRSDRRRPTPHGDQRRR